MRKALLVDDDYLVRSYLKMLPSWSNSGFTIEADVRDGEEALEFLQSNDVDLVVTDIAMPLMDGIQLIQEIRKTEKHIYIIVLSCHDDFEYVKKAMQEGADEYVLKNTLDEESLTTLLGAVTDKMQEKPKEGLSPKPTAQKSDEEHANRKYLFFNQVLSGMLKEEERESERIKADIHGLYQNSAVVVMKLETKDVSEDPWIEIKTEQYCLTFLKRFQKELKHLLPEQEKEIEVIYLGNGVFCCFIDLSGIHKSSVMYQKLTGVASACYKLCRSEEYSYKIGVSSICLGSEALRQAYQQARAMIKICFYEQDEISYYEAGKSAGTSLPREAQEFLSQIETMRLGNDKSRFLNMGRSVVSSFKRELTDSRLVLQWLHRVQQAAVLDEQGKYSEIQNIEEISVFLERAAKKLFEFVDVQIPEQVSNPVRIAAQFAAGHFKEPIGLGDSARAAGVNSTYLSYLFSQEMGIGFANYLLKLRIDYAKKLLRESSLKIREVAENSGFNDYHYFSKVFKKMNGVSPAEYQKVQKRGGDAAK